MLLSKKSPLFFATALVLSLATIVHAQANTASVAGAATTSAPSMTTSSAVASSTDVVDPCLAQCAQTSATKAGCANADDTTCVCKSPTFKTDFMTCLQTTCTPAAAAQAQALGARKCSAASGAPPVAGGPRTNVASAGGSSVNKASSTMHPTRPATRIATSTATKSTAHSFAKSAATAIELNDILSVALGFMGLALGVVLV
ncbi:uncharacterized protein FOMMEDRAFT_29522 [Fomitiporia mediterranea MF3/22]|uniref:uncharacterized protein n=1 Tax=Fomitiporia mediterranea (strain MF3/22) TaxID=694068 RepID=UPI00044073D3|nr:uncharacterized protein FOMMEDRAFT_29522 [Fomitiporia mediterranea MF3/22]EJD02527.1 hypothetical protein FOMMEDRAFT_29522 [Fomitiporia mediterranea MF3/22]